MLAARASLRHGGHMETTAHDVAVIGGGAAGLSAALVLTRARRRVVVIDGGAPRNAPAAHMQGFISRDGLPPSELLELARAEVRGYGAELLADEVVEVADGFSLHLASGRTLGARRIVLATGATDVLPEIAGARERWGRDFLHCPYCHGWEVRDRPLGVLASVEHAQLLRQGSDDVVLFAHTESPSPDERTALAARGIEVVEGRVARFAVVEDRLAAVELEDGRSIPREAVFMRPTLRPNAPELIAQLGCEVDAGGFVRAGAAGETSVPGVWAVGNVANPRAQVITAAGEGSAAAIALNNDLVREDVEEELR
jgi:thioredoxin reductase